MHVGVGHLESNHGLSNALTGHGILHRQGDLLAEDTAREIDAVICFGVIVKGDTLHFEMISEESMRGLGQVMHEFRRPVLVEILPVFDIQQAIDRCSDDEFNKGIEAAVAAIEMIHWRRGVTGAN